MIFIAPVQGHTDAAWRHFHKEVYGGKDKYFTPFIRCDQGELRPKDLRDLKSELNQGTDLEPQVIFRDMQELDLLLHAMEEAGQKRVNLNMGCPFPLQTGKGRGAGFLPNVNEASKLPEVLKQHPGIEYSVKMRLGMDKPDEWRKLMPVLNSIPFSHITLHPRTGHQQYKGEVLIEEFASFLEESANPVVYNGGIQTPGEITEIRHRFPDISGVMVGRGVLGRPSLSAEESAGHEWDLDKRLEHMLRFHRLLLDYHSANLCGESQILSKIKPFWEYAENEIGRKAWKAVKKAGTLAKYNSAVASIGKSS